MLRTEAKDFKENFVTASLNRVIIFNSVSNCLMGGGVRGVVVCALFDFCRSYFVAESLIFTSNKEQKRNASQEVTRAGARLLIV